MSTRLRRGLPELGETGRLTGKSCLATRFGGQGVDRQHPHPDQNKPNQPPNQGLNKAARKTLKMKGEVSLTQSRLTLCDPMDCM